jgi:hypothetical protein
MSGQISWCAILVCWIYHTISSRYEYLKKEEKIYFEIFKSIVTGEVRFDLEESFNI